MTDRAAQDAADQRVRVIEIGGVAGASGDLVDAVDQRHAAQSRRGIGAHGRVSAAVFTDSTIFT